MKLTLPMQREILNLADGRRLGAGLVGMSAWGGLTGTISALRRRGLITDKHTLTEAGRAEARRLKGPVR